MKTNLYILLILLLSFSFANAQSTQEEVKVETNDIVSVSNVETPTVLVDASQVKQSIARSSSDIRIFLNRERNVENIKLVFPKINKAVKA